MNCVTRLCVMCSRWRWEELGEWAERLLPPQRDPQSACW